GARHVVEQQRAAQLALHVAAAHDLAQITVRGAIDQLRGQTEFSVVEYPDYDAGAALLLGAAAFYGKFHECVFLSQFFVNAQLSRSFPYKVKAFGLNDFSPCPDR